MRNFLLPLIALGMLLFGVNHIRARQKEIPQTPPPIAPASSPYLNRVAGAGLVGQGRLVLFYAAVATLSVLLEQSYRAAHADI